jgi:hypothetical protein
MEAVTGITGLVIIVLLFLVFRAIVLWYWRVNEGIVLLKSIDEKLGRLAGMEKPTAT